MSLKRNDKRKTKMRGIRRLTATIKQAGKGIVKKSYGRYAQTYGIGFINNNGTEDETELNATDMRDLEKLWKSLCEEFECKPNSVLYVEAA
mgnify:CR=1 FL=1